MDIEAITNRIMERYNKKTESKGDVLREDIIDYLHLIDPMPLEDKLDHLERFLSKFPFLTEIDKMKILKDINSY